MKSAQLNGVLQAIKLAKNLCSFQIIHLSAISLHSSVVAWESCLKIPAIALVAYNRGRQGALAYLAYLLLHSDRRTSSNKRAQQACTMTFLLINNSAA